MTKKDRRARQQAARNKSGASGTKTDGVPKDVDTDHSSTSSHEETVRTDTEYQDDVSQLDTRQQKRSKTVASYSNTPPFSSASSASSPLSSVPPVPIASTRPAQQAQAGSANNSADMHTPLPQDHLPHTNEQDLPDMETGHDFSPAHDDEDFVFDDAASHQSFSPEHEDSNKELLSRPSNISRHARPKEVQDSHMSENEQEIAAIMADSTYFRVAAPASQIIKTDETRKACLNRVANYCISKFTTFVKVFLRGAKDSGNVGGDRRQVT